MALTRQLPVAYGRIFARAANVMDTTGAIAVAARESCCGYAARSRGDTFVEGLVERRTVRNPAQPGVGGRAVRLSNMLQLRCDLGKDDRNTFARGTRGR